MDLTHRFSVPAGVAEAWDAFNDLEGLAPCFPGATITSVDGDEFSGSVKIKLGPISLMYNGSGRYIERNDADRRVVIEARGKDKRGNGTATATVTASFAESGGQTDVEVLTDLVITGKPAQFGRGVISDVSDKLLDQFVSCVSGRFADGLGADGLGADGSVRPEPSRRRARLERLPQLPRATRRTPSRPSSSRLCRPRRCRPRKCAATAAAAVAADSPAESPSARQPSPAYSAPPQPDSGESTLNVLSTVGPVLLKRYGPALAVVGLLIFVVIKIIRRKS